MTGDWVQHACMMTHNSPSLDHTRHNLINLGHGSFQFQNIRNDTFFCVFGRLLGARAHHKGLRRLKPFQYRRTVYWHWEFGKFVGMLMHFDLLTICHSWRIRCLCSKCAWYCQLYSALCKFDQMKKNIWMLFSCRLAAWCETYIIKGAQRAHVVTPIFTTITIS